MFYGLDTEPEPERKRNLSKVGTGTVKNNCGSATPVVECGDAFVLYPAFA
jgi:hypothetical protein